MKRINIDKAFTKFKPEQCVFVISGGENPSGMVAGWSMKCSSDPYMYAVALWKKGYTHKLIRRSKEFVIAVPNKRIEKELRIFGSTHGNKIDKFKKTGLRTQKSRFIKTPLIADATFNFECRFVKEISVGDHIIFIGKVLAAYYNKGKGVLMNMGRFERERIFKEF